MKKELRRRSAVEPVIGHMKNGGKLGRNIRLILKKLREKLFLFFIGLLLAAQAPL